MVGYRYLPLHLYRERLRGQGLSQTEKNLYMLLRLCDGAMCGFFRITLAEVSFQLEVELEEVREAFAALEKHGSSVFDNGYVFLPRYSEDITAITVDGRWSKWPEHLRGIISAYTGEPDNRAWRAFLDRFHEMIEEALPGRWMLLQIPKGSGNGGATPEISEPDDITKLLQLIESGVPDEFLPNGNLKKKTTQFDRNWVVSLYNGYGYERLTKAINDVLAKGWKGKVSKERAEAAIKGTLDTFFDSTNNGRYAPSAPSSSDRFIDFGDGMMVPRY